jgi:alpha-L-fucosidase 2
LLRCVDGEIVLLPSLPPAWPAGEVRGLRARGGFEVDIRWRNGALENAQLRGTPGGKALVRHGESVRMVRVGTARSVSFTAADFG